MLDVGEAPGERFRLAAQDMCSDRTTLFDGRLNVATVRRLVARNLGQKGSGIIRNRLGCGTRQRRTGGDGLPASALSAIADYRAIGDSGMADFAGEAVAPSNEPIFSDNPRADACADRDVDEITTAPCRAAVPFADRRALRVILERYGKTGSFCQQGGQGDIVPSRQRRDGRHDARPTVESARYADAHATRVRTPDRCNQVLDLGDGRLRTFAARSNPADVQ